MRQLIWLRCNLHAHDNHALSAALAGGPTLALYLLSPGQWRSHNDTPCKVDF
ncbi:deoxyribodipyrimidine photo-lyase [Azotobacter armeniacus]